MVGIIIIVCVVFVFTYLMFAPFFIEIDSDEALYGIRFHKLARARFVFNRDSTIYLDLQIVYWQKKIDLLKLNTKGKSEVERKSKKEKKRISMKTLKNLLKTFKINHLALSIDTGSMPLNGLLFPLLFLYRYQTGRDVRINFINENKLVLQIENNLARLIWAYIK